MGKGQIPALWLITIIFKKAKVEQYIQEQFLGKILAFGENKGHKHYGVLWDMLSGLLPSGYTDETVLSIVTVFGHCNFPASNLTFSQFEMIVKEMGRCELLQLLELKLNEMYHDVVCNEIIGRMLYNNKAKTLEDEKEESKRVSDMQQRQARWKEAYFDLDIEQYNDINSMKNYVKSLETFNVPSLAQRHCQWYDSIDANKRRLPCQPPPEADILRNIPQLLHNGVEIVKRLLGCSIGFARLIKKLEREKEKHDNKNRKGKPLFDEKNDKTNDKLTRVSSYKHRCDIILLSLLKLMIFGKCGDAEVEQFKQYRYNGCHIFMMYLIELSECIICDSKSIAELLWQFIDNNEESKEFLLTYHLHTMVDFERRWSQQEMNEQMKKIECRAGLVTKQQLEKEKSDLESKFCRYQQFATCMVNRFQSIIPNELPDAGLVSALHKLKRNELLKLQITREKIDIMWDKIKETENSDTLRKIIYQHLSLAKKLKIIQAIQSSKINKKRKEDGGSNNRREKKWSNKRKERDYQKLKQKEIEDEQMRIREAEMNQPFDATARFMNRRMSRDFQKWDQQRAMQEFNNVETPSTVQFNSQQGGMVDAFSLAAGAPNNRDRSAPPQAHHQKNPSNLGTVTEAEEDDNDWESQRAGTEYSSLFDKNLKSKFGKYEGSLREYQEAAAETSQFAALVDHLVSILEKENVSEAVRSTLQQVSDHGRGLAHKTGSFEDRMRDMFDDLARNKDDNENDNDDDKIGHGRRESVGSVIDMDTRDDMPDANRQQTTVFKDAPMKQQQQQQEQGGHLGVTVRHQLSSTMTEVEVKDIAVETKGDEMDDNLDEFEDEMDDVIVHQTGRRASLPNGKNEDNEDDNDDENERKRLMEIVEGFVSGDNLEPTNDDLLKLNEDTLAAPSDQINWLSKEQMQNLFLNKLPDDETLLKELQFGVTRDEAYNEVEFMQRLDMKMKEAKMKDAAAAEEEKMREEKEAKLREKEEMLKRKHDQQNDIIEYNGEIIKLNEKNRDIINQAVSEAKKLSEEKKDEKENDKESSNELKADEIDNVLLGTKTKEAAIKQLGKLSEEERLKRKEERRKRNQREVSGKDYLNRHRRDLSSDLVPTNVVKEKLIAYKASTTIAFAETENMVIEKFRKTRQDRIDSRLQDKLEKAKHASQEASSKMKDGIFSQEEKKAMESDSDSDDNVAKDVASHVRKKSESVAKHSREASRIDWNMFGLNNQEAGHSRGSSHLSLELASQTQSGKPGHRPRQSMGRLTMMEQDLHNLGAFGQQIQETAASKGSAARDNQYDAMLDAVIQHGEKKDAQTTTQHHRRLSSHHFVKQFLAKDKDKVAIVEQAMAGESPLQLYYLDIVETRDEHGGLSYKLNRESSQDGSMSHATMMSMDLEHAMQTAIDEKENEDESGKKKFVGNKVLFGMSAKDVFLDDMEIFDEMVKYYSYVKTRQEKKSKQEFEQMRKQNESLENEVMELRKKKQELVRWIAAERDAYTREKQELEQRKREAAHAQAVFEDAVTVVKDKFNESAAQTIQLMKRRDALKKHFLLTKSRVYKEQLNVANETDRLNELIQKEHYLHEIHNTFEYQIGVLSDLCDTQRACNEEERANLMEARFDLSAFISSTDQKIKRANQQIEKYKKEIVNARMELQNRAAELRNIKKNPSSNRVSATVGYYEKERTMFEERLQSSSSKIDTFNAVKKKWQEKIKHHVASIAAKEEEAKEMQNQIVRATAEVEDLWSKLLVDVAKKGWKHDVKTFAKYFEVYHSDEMKSNSNSNVMDPVYTQRVSERLMEEQVRIADMLSYNTEVVSYNRSNVMSSIKDICDKRGIDMNKLKEDNGEAFDALIQDLGIYEAPVDKVALAKFLREAWLEDKRPTNNEIIQKLNQYNRDELLELLPDFTIPANDDDADNIINGSNDNDVERRLKGNIRRPQFRAALFNDNAKYKKHKLANLGVLDDYDNDTKTSSDDKMGKFGRDVDLRAEWGLISHLSSDRRKEYMEKVLLPNVDPEWNIDNLARKFSSDFNAQLQEHERKVEELFDKLKSVSRHGRRKSTKMNVIGPLADHDNEEDDDDNETGNGNGFNGLMRSGNGGISTFSHANGDMMNGMNGMNGVGNASVASNDLNRPPSAQSDKSGEFSVLSGGQYTNSINGQTPKATN